MGKRKFLLITKRTHTHRETQRHTSRVHKRCIIELNGKEPAGECEKNVCDNLGMRSIQKVCHTKRLLGAQQMNSPFSLFSIQTVQYVYMCVSMSGHSENTGPYQPLNLLSFFSLPKIHSFFFSHKVLSQLYHTLWRAITLFL